MRRLGDDVKVVDQRNHHKIESLVLCEGHLVVARYCVNGV